MDPQSRRGAGSGTRPLRPSTEDCGNQGSGQARWNGRRRARWEPGRGSGDCKHRLGRDRVVGCQASGVTSGPGDGWSRAAGRSQVTAVCAVREQQERCRREQRQPATNECKEWTRREGRERAGGGEKYVIIPNSDAQRQVGRSKELWGAKGL